MTMPNERTRAVLYTEQFLVALLNAAETPRVPLEVRRRAARCLRHYPHPYEMKQAAKDVPNVFGPPDA